MTGAARSSSDFTEHTEASRRPAVMEFRLEVRGAEGNLTVQEEYHRAIFSL